MRMEQAGSLTPLVGKLDQAQMFVEELGGRGETLVFVHGLGGSTNTWYPQAQILNGICA